jgi:hypothetical protein
MVFTDYVFSAVCEADFKGIAAPTSDIGKGYTRLSL